MVHSVPPQKHTVLLARVLWEWVLSRPVLECNQFSPPLVHITHLFFTMDSCRTTSDMGCTKSETSKWLAVRLKKKPEKVPHEVGVFENPA